MIEDMKMTMAELITIKAVGEKETGNQS